MTLPPISKKTKKRVSHRPERVNTILEKSEENDVIEKEIDDNIGQTGGSVNTILTKKQNN